MSECYNMGERAGHLDMGSKRQSPVSGAPVVNDDHCKSKLYPRLEPWQEATELMCHQLLEKKYVYNQTYGLPNENKNNVHKWDEIPTCV